jgi:hypothetical protein
LSRAWVVLLASLLPSIAQGEFEFDFDVGSYERKPYEVSGYLEGTFEHFVLDRDAALYALLFPNAEQRSFKRYRATGNLSGLYRWDATTLNGRLQAEVRDDVFGSSEDVTAQELYLTHEPSERVSLEAGKRTLRWGAGYAWNPVAFLERPKDPTDPELTREGFVMASAEYVRSFDGPLRTLVIQPVILPVNDELNDDFGQDTALNPALRMYLLYRDTDIHLLARANGSRAGALGIALSRNLAPHFEVHGELAAFGTREVRVLNDDGTLGSRGAQRADLLLGLRYLTESDTTWIAEYYHNGAGYTRSELEDFFALARDAPEDATTRARAAAARQAGYGGPQVMRDYLYLRARRNEPWGWVYWNLGATAVVNLHDGSASVLPEVTYTGIRNLELRGRLAALTGGRNTEFGERQNDWRMEIRARYRF